MFPVVQERNYNHMLNSNLLSIPTPLELTQELLPFQISATNLSIFKIAETHDSKILALEFKSDEKFLEIAGGLVFVRLPLNANKIEKEHIKNHFIAFLMKKITFATFLIDGYSIGDLIIDDCIQDSVYYSNIKIKTNEPITEQTKSTNIEILEFKTREEAIEEFRNLIS